MIVFWGLVGGCVYLVYRPSGGLHLQEVKQQVRRNRRVHRGQSVSRRAGWPRVIANFALTADGKISTRSFTPTGFTSKADKRRLQEIRCLGDALLAGARTISTDRMSMGISASDLRERRKAIGLPAEPLRVIVSNSGGIDPHWKVFQTVGSQVIAFSTQRMPQRLRASIARRADLWIFNSPKVDLAAMLRILRRHYRVRTLVCEGGPRLFRALLEIGAVDELRLTWTPLIFGGVGAPTLTGIPERIPAQNDLLPAKKNGDRRRRVLPDLHVVRRLRALFPVRVSLRDGAFKGHLLSSWTARLKASRKSGNAASTRFQLGIIGSPSGSLR